MWPKEKEKLLYIDQLVFRFQDGDKEAGEELSKLFGCHPSGPLRLYIGKYFNLLRFGRFSFNDKDSRKFISCVIADPKLRERLRPAYQYRETKIQTMRYVYKLSELCASIAEDELIQELTYLFLRQAKRYKKKRKHVNFAGYLYNSYRYAVIDYINKRVRKYDPYLHMYSKYELPAFNDELYIDSKTEIDINEITISDVTQIVDDDTLGNSWVRGLTCGPEFRDLNDFQRLILKLHFEDKMTDGKIAERFNMHINTIHKHRKRAENIIKETRERLFKEGYDE
jgi:RNA polymerase sigma factor (sigma-70 family)